MNICLWCGVYIEEQFQVNQHCDYVKQANQHPAQHKGEIKRGMKILELDGDQQEHNM